MVWPGLEDETPESDDSFLRQVADNKARTDALIAAASKRHEHELERRFAKDVKLKEQLSKFARKNELDRVLISLWEEIERYPALLGENDFDKYNTLHLSGVSDSKEKDTESIQFTLDSQNFKVTQQTWQSGEYNHANFAFYENGEEVFAINCIEDYSAAFDRSYKCFGISAFKKHGTWAKVLLHCYGQIQIERNERSAEARYFPAREIKCRFQG